MEKGGKFMKYSEENLRKYIKKCFEDAFKSENRSYDEKLWSFEWIMIKNSKGIYQLYPIAQCKYQRVSRRVCYRLQNNLQKNFGLLYKNTDDLRCLFYENGQIDYNFTQAMFQTQNGNISLSVFDENTNPYENEKKGQCMIANTFEKLLFNYWELNADLYNELPENDKRRYLPQFISKDWNTFKELYKKTFGEEIGSRYDIACSSGIKRIY